MAKNELRQRALAVIGCATGAAVAAHAAWGVSLPLAVAVTIAGAAAVAAVLVPRLPAGLRSEAARRARVGAAAGLVATVSYDVARFGTVSVFRMSFQPFHVFELFGRPFVGEGAPVAAAFAAGALVHLCNGVGFGVAYVLFVRRPRILSGLAWAYVLEAFMVTLYPSWLQLQALGEFTQVSFLGHSVYGIVLALVSRRLLDARIPAEPAMVEVAA
ncbi:MAG: hypothetical protein U0Q07_20480 [Acidimicrobiales bacterium]